MLLKISSILRKVIFPSDKQNTWYFETQALFLIGELLQEEFLIVS